MPLSINTNIASMTAQRSFLNSNQALETAFERLSTGKRVNSAVDDAAGLAIGKDLESRVRGLNQAVRNVNDGISMVQVVEGALDEVTSILQRMRDLSVQAANGSLTTTEQGYLDTEHSKLASALDDVLGQAVFGNTDLVSTSNTTVTIHSGADASDTVEVVVDALSANTLAVDAGQVSMKGQEVVEFALTDAQVDATDAANDLIITVGGNAFTIDASSMDATDGSTSHGVLGVVTDLNDGTVSGFNTNYLAAEGADGDTIIITKKTPGNVTSTSNTIQYQDGGGTTAGTVVQEGGTYGIAAIDTALATIASDRATLGATQTQLESMVRNLANVAENTSAAAGRIMDTDYAAETANLTKAQILQQAATSILAQANAQPQAVLSLLQ
jgi:flagellin